MLALRQRAAVLVVALGMVGVAPAASQTPPPSVKHTICETFGRYCSQALRVSWCESRWSTTARNGQYLGLFQMGSAERSRYGHGHTALTQSLAARAYFRVSGRDWSPWSCKP